MTLTAHALGNEPILRRLAEPGDAPGSLAELGREAGIPDQSNASKAIRRLRDDGLIDPDQLALTDGGRRTLDAIDYAAGRLALSAGREIAVRLDELSPHPANPRHMIDDEQVRSLAEAIASAGEVKHPLAVTPPDEAGQRYILAGQRRWLATTMLSAEGRWPAERTLPAIEQTVDDDAGVILAGLLENTGEPLSELDEARALRVLCEQYSWSATECARKTGRLVRTVQHRLQILAKADPEDIAAVERGELRYGELREKVQTRKPKAAFLTDKLALLVLEIADVAQRKCGGRFAFIDCRPEPGGALSTLVERKVVLTVSRTHMPSGQHEITAVALAKMPELEAWIAETAFDEDPSGVLYALRSEVAGPVVAELHKNGDPFTPWLNVEPAEPAAPKAPEPLPDLTPGEALVVVEVKHKIMTAAVNIDGLACAKSDGIPAGRTTDGVVRKGLLIASAIDGHWIVRLTKTGLAWAAEHAPAGEIDARLGEIREAAAVAPNGGDHYVTPWLNPPRKPADAARKTVEKAADAFKDQMARAQAEGDDDAAIEADAAAARHPFMLSGVEAMLLRKGLERSIALASDAGDDPTPEQQLADRLVTFCAAWA